VALIIRAANVRGTACDVRVEGDRITDVAPMVASVRGDDEIDAQGGALIPGLHDHHIHLRAWAASRESVFVGPCVVKGEQRLAAALREAGTGHDGWVRAVGYHESVAGSLDRDFLDRLAPDRPVRVQHRSGALWMLNSPALKLVGADDDLSAGIERSADGRATGRLWRMDDWLADRLARSSRTGGRTVSRSDWFGSAVAALSETAAARGVTGWTDATPDRDERETALLFEAAASGSITQRLHLMQPLEAEDQDHAAGRAGPVKVLLDDMTLPTLEWLSGVVSAAHRQQRAVAVHCVTTSQLALAVSAFECSAGQPPAQTETDREGDRIEHGAVIPAGFLPLMADHRLTVITQPNFVYERGDDYLSEVEGAELQDLWRARSLIAAGVPLAAGTDAPFGSPDPWLAVRASMRRKTRSGSVLKGGEVLDWSRALGLWLGDALSPAVPREVSPGQRGDLVLLGAGLPEALDGQDPVDVRATVIKGEVAFTAD
jgi:predicted amidohydrolase YtcJ